MAEQDRAALVELFDATGGSARLGTRKWNTRTKLEEWGGVEVNNHGRVRALNLRFSRLRGPIPDALGGLTQLRQLWLDNNQLSGPIPDAFGGLTQLERLSLSRNPLSGPIPAALGGLTQLERLWLFSNQLSGPIPAALGGLTQLEQLWLDNNQLSGPIPDALGGLTQLRQLSLDNNQLSGPIPAALGGLTQLERLWLFSNQLSGTVPLSILELPSLGLLDMSGNLLTCFTDPKGQRPAADQLLVCMERLESQSGLKTAGNPWEFPPAAVVARGRESIEKYYDTWEQCKFELERVDALKVVLVGTRGAGKTSLARSIKLGRGDRTPEEDEDKRSTVGIDLHGLQLRNGTECKIYDVAGQITYYGLHQFFLTERAVYVVVWDATKFEGLHTKDLDKAIEDNILEWVSLLHMRTPRCSVMLVASHCDKLNGAAPGDKKELLSKVQERFTELHDEWKRKRHSSTVDERMTIMSKVYAVACTLKSESASYTASDGLQAIDEALSEQMAVASLVPPSWVAARHVLEQVGGAYAAEGEMGVESVRKPWELRSVIHNKFQDYVYEVCREASQGGQHEHPASYLRALSATGIRDSMDGAIELRAFSGTLISHDVFVVLDVMWLAGILKPILDHRGIMKSETGEQLFANRVLKESCLLTWATELVDNGILRKSFARFLWNLKEQDTANAHDRNQVYPAMFEEILDKIGVTIPLPAGDNVRSDAPGAMRETHHRGNGTDGDDGPDGVDLLVIMRLPLEADDEVRRRISSAREAILGTGDGSGSAGLKAVFEFDHAGAPHGLPERVIALSHKIGKLSTFARWRHGGLYSLYGNSRTFASSMILEYDKRSGTFGIEVLGRSAPDLKAFGFVISALYHVANDFPGAYWTSWMECGMRHDGEKMYHLAASDEKQNQSAGSWIVPLIRDSASGGRSRQPNLCRRNEYHPVGSCTVDPEILGKVLGVRQPYLPSEVSGTEEVNHPPRGEERSRLCPEAYRYVPQGLPGRIFGASLSMAFGLVVAVSAVDDAPHVLFALYGFFTFFVLVTLVACVFLVRENIAEGRRRELEMASAAQQGQLGHFLSLDEEV